MNDKTLVEMLAGWSDSEFAVAASGEYCEDLKSLIEGELAKQDDTIEAQATRIKALEAALRIAAKAERDRLRKVADELESALNAPSWSMALTHVHAAAAALADALASQP